MDRPHPPNSRRTPGWGFPTGDGMATLAVNDTSSWSSTATGVPNSDQMSMMDNTCGMERHHVTISTDPAYLTELRR
jgi:hypothetical protein